MKDHIQEYKYKKIRNIRYFATIIISSSRPNLTQSVSRVIERLTPLMGTFATHHKQLLNFRHSLKRILKLRPFVRAYVPLHRYNNDRSINQSINQSADWSASLTHCTIISKAERIHTLFIHSLPLSLSLSVCDRIYWIRLKNTLIRLDIGRHARQMQYIRRANSAVTVYHRNALNRSTRVFNRLPLYFSTKPHHHFVKVAFLSPSLFPSLFQLSNTSHWKCSKRKVYAFSRVSNDIASSSVIFIRHGFFPVKYFLDVYNWERLV